MHRRPSFAKAGTSLHSSEDEREWLADRETELLPVSYFHVVFTLPAAIAAIAWQNKRVVYNLLFKASAETLLRIAADPKHLARASLSPRCCTPGARQ
jgi:hypothetical protein